MKHLSKQMGISLVEILVALVISVFLLGGIVQVYLGNKTTFAFTSALAEVQENGRFALDTMGQDLRLTNQWGCISFDPDDTDNINDTLDAGLDNDFYDFLGEEAIEGTDGGAGPDTLIIRGGKPGQTNVEAPFIVPTTKTLYTNPTGSIEADDIILVARCGQNDLLIEAEADILEVKSVDVSDPLQTMITLEENKSQQFENDAVVIGLQTVTYTIGTGANGRPALFRQEFDAAPQELIEGVQSMQILYGVDNDNDQFPNQYVKADHTALSTDFSDVVSVRVMLLLSSFDDFVTEDPQKYTYNFATTTATDRRLRQVFTTTIALRNRIGS